VNLFHRKKNWRRTALKAGTAAYKNAAIRTAGAALAGAVSVTAASAAVSSRRRRSEG
jgi:hypothetical protein